MERPQGRLGQLSHTGMCLCMYVCTSVFLGGKYLLCVCVSPTSLTGYSPTGPPGAPSSPLLSPPIPSSLSPLPTVLRATSVRPNAAVNRGQPSETASHHNTQPLITSTANNRGLPTTDVATSANNRGLPTTDVATLANNRGLPTTDIITSANSRGLPTTGVLTLANNSLPTSGALITTNNRSLPTTNLITTANNRGLPITSPSITAPPGMIVNIGPVRTEDAPKPVTQDQIINFLQMWQT